MKFEGRRQISKACCDRGGRPLFFGSVEQLGCWGLGFSPNSVDTLRGSYGNGEGADAQIAEAHGRARLIRCCLQYVHAPRNPRSAFRLRRPPAAGASDDCALVVAPCAFSHMVVTFRGRRKGSLVLFGASKSTFRDRCKGWIGAVLLRRTVFAAGAALDFVTGAVNRDFLTCGSCADFVAGAALGKP